MIPEWIIRHLKRYGNCYLYLNQRKYDIYEIQKLVGKKIIVRSSYYCEGCGIVLEVVS